MNRITKLVDQWKPSELEVIAGLLEPRSRPETIDPVAWTPLSLPLLVDCVGGERSTIPEHVNE